MDCTYDRIFEIPDIGFKYKGVFYGLIRIIKLHAPSLAVIDKLPGCMNGIGESLPVGIMHYLQGEDNDLHDPAANRLSFSIQCVKAGCIMDYIMPALIRSKVEHGMPRLVYREGCVR